MNNFVSKDLCKGANVRDLIDPKFKTMRISLNVILPLTVETASVNAILPSIVSRATLDYPNFTLLSKHLAELYGATLDSSVSKIGDNQILSISASAIANKYTLEGEDLAKELSELICSAVFSPVVDDECILPEETFKQEKRQLLETIDADCNDKKNYAKAQCVEIMFKHEPAGIKRYGTKESVAKIERKTLLSTWLNLIQSGRVEIFVLGDCNYSVVYKAFNRYFDLERFPVDLNNRIVLRAGQPKEVVENLKVAQSKLVMGFRTGVIPEDSVPTRVMSVLFGGSASSKLFLNVREKLSLCYYCSSRVNEIKGSMFVESGVETCNIEKAKEAILEQLKDICEGNFTQEDITYAKLSMINSYRGIGDSLYATENWYLNQMFSYQIFTPDDMIGMVSEVTRLDIIEAARKVSLDTIFILKGEENDG